MPEEPIDTQDPPNPPESVDPLSLDAVGALAEPTRRALYEYVVGRRTWVSRDEAAEALGLRRGITVHHLDRLEAEGLLETDRRRLTGRSGPGAGRPAKVYRRSPTDVDVSLPPRRYDLAGQLLAEAADRSRAHGTPIEEEIRDAARAEGLRIAESGRRRLAANGRDETTDAVRERRAVLFDELRARGFEPDEDDDGVTILHNCPFHRLSQDHTELICTMNLCLLDAVVEGLGGAGVDPRLEPSPDTCCVRFHPIAGEATQPLG